MKTGYEVRPIPENVHSQLRQALQGLGTEHRYQLSRVVESAYMRGYDDGVRRGERDAYDEASNSEALRARQHEDTCPARRRYPKCQCATPPIESTEGGA